MTFDLSNGLSIVRIRDMETGHVFLTGRHSLFELAPDNDGSPCPGDGAVLQSKSGLTVDKFFTTGTSQLVVKGHVKPMPELFYSLNVGLPADSAVATLKLTFTNRGSVPVCIRSVFPKIRGLVPAGDPLKAMGTVPTEIGGVARLSAGTLGMPFESRTDLDVGLPRSMNSMEVATVYDPDGGGGLFFSDVDGDPDVGVPALQFTLSAQEVAGFWVGRVGPGATESLSRLAIGVYHKGDWHQAVDYWLEKHRTRIRKPDIPAWLRSEGAIYSFAGGGAGGIYLDLPRPPLANGQIVTSFEVNNGPWDDKPALPLTVANVAPAGAYLSGIARNKRQEDIFFAAQDGSVQTLFEVDDGAWSAAIPLTLPAATKPGGYTAPVKRNAVQEDLFYIGSDNEVWTVFELDDGPWSQPVRLSWRRTGTAPAGGGIAAVMRNNRQEDVFFVGFDGSVQTLFQVDNGPWSAPIALTGVSFALAGQPLAAVRRNARQEDVFLCGADGGLWTLFEVDNGPWSAPIALTGPGFCSPGSPVAAVMRNDLQEDVFVVGTDGAFWTLFQVNNSAFSAPIRLTGPKFTVAGAHLSAVVRNARQLDLFLVDKFGGAHTLFVVDDGAWSKPAFIGLAFLPPGAPITGVRRNGRQMDVFALQPGRINSFLDLPQLLEEAKAFNTNVVYLWDYWEGVKAGGLPPYWNKGDYLPRSDLGGEHDLIEGIRRLHDAGGRIIVYVEPFIVYPFSQIGLQQGPAWEAWDAAGPMLLKEPYFNYFKMVVPHLAWQDYLVEVCRRLVADYGVDGILLDSGGWQLNWPVKPGATGSFYSSAEYTLGFFQFVDRLRTTLRSIPGKGDVVVLGETTSGPVAGHWDGGFSADFSFNQPHSGARILGSPVRYGLPHVNFLSNGKNLNELHQIYAAGHGLALCCNFPGNYLYDKAAYVGNLVQIRKDHADALVFGKQSYQPSTGRGNVVAYFYRGAGEDIITVVNTSYTDPYEGRLALRRSEADSVWQDLVTGEVFITQRRLTPPFFVLPLTVPAEGLRVLSRLQ